MKIEPKNTPILLQCKEIKKEFWRMGLMNICQNQLITVIF